MSTPQSKHRRNCKLTFHHRMTNEVTERPNHAMQNCSGLSQSVPSTNWSPLIPVLATGWPDEELRCFTKRPSKWLHQRQRIFSVNTVCCRPCKGRRPLIVPLHPLKLGIPLRVRLGRERLSLAAVLGTCVHNPRDETGRVGAFLHEGPLLLGFARHAVLLALLSNLLSYRGIL